MPEGSFHLVLIRPDTAVGDMTEVTEAEILEPPVMRRPGWNTTLNEVKIQFPMRTT